MKPEDANLNRALGELTPTQREYLELLLRRKGEPQEDLEEDLVELSRQSGESDRSPLSFAQQRLWFMDRVEPGNASYNIPTGLRLQGQLEAGALRRSLREIARRHSVMKSVFQEDDGRVSQVVQTEFLPRLPIVDLSSLDNTSRESETLRASRDWFKIPFDLERGPLWRPLLLRLADDEHILMLTIHHIVFDAWSVGIFYRELASLYSAFRTGKQADLPEPAIQYSDFARWQRKRLRGRFLESQLDYWKRCLQDLPASLNLPFDFPRPPQQTFAGAEVSFRLDEATTAKLKELSRHRGCSLFMTLLAAFKALLFRYTQQSDIVVGSPIANRNRQELEGLIGFFVNNLVLRTDLSGDPGFNELLGRVRDTTLEAYDHQDLPFEKLVEELQPKRDLSRPPLFQVMFQLQNASPKAYPLADLKSRFLRIDTGRVTFDLVVNLVESAGSLSGSFDYCSDLFEKATVERLAQHYGNLLKDAAKFPHRRISRLCLLSHEERKLLLEDWNDTESEWSTTPSFLAALEKGVERFPDRIAVYAGGKQVSYRELYRRVRLLAAHLTELGLGPGKLAAVCLQRSLEMLIALLSILKAGAAYVPLDPTYPKRRLAYMLEDSQPLVLVSSSGLSNQLFDFSGILVELDEGWESRLRPASDQRGREAGGEEIAYVIYTSGSTGNPKGVEITHRSLVNLLNSALDPPLLSSSDVFLAVSTPSFDISALELFAPLLAGSRLLIADNDEVTDPALLARRIVLGEVTVLQATPSRWRMLCRESGWEGRLRALAGGETLPRELAEKVLHRCPTLWNLYGPTETTIWSIIGEVVRGQEGPVPLGRPIANTRVYILDAGLQPVPTGVAGELFLGGAGVSPCYHNSPALTAERFIPDPFSPERGARFYRTGDLVRYRKNGDIVFLGRVDDQVKVRGYRIELGEIEANLNRHPEVSEAAVVARRDQAGGTFLAGYVVASASKPPAGEDLRAFLLQRLPEYMVPTLFRNLESMPRTSNGKIDRRALPEPEGHRPDLNASFLEPRDEIEKQIAAIWQNVLQIEKAGVNDNFFDLGGHSMRLVEVRSRLSKALGTDLSLIELFQYPTISSLARHIGKEVAARPAPRPAASAQADGRLEDTSHIAVIGMAGRFPGAPTLEQFWCNLHDGIESLTRFSERELQASGVDPSHFRHPDYVQWGGILDQIEAFDAPFFGISPGEARIIDPQHRIFLECCWEAFENAGRVPGDDNGAVGVFAGCSQSAYWSNNLNTRPEVLEKVGDFSAYVGNEKDFLPTRISYLLNLRGPSVNVQTACSTSLVAIHLACRSLRDGECDLALAGGVTVNVPQKVGYLYQEGGIRSPDGHCRAFDAQARGTVFGSGAGVVLLKPLDKALSDGDPIQAVIRGSAINNDGSLKVGFTAPGVEGQAEVLREAFRRSGVDPRSLSLIEAHGTGTELGDPIELTALEKAFGDVEGQRNFCAIGSVKSNIGHLDCAAGVAGFLKAVLALQNRMLPPSLHFRQPNPQFDLEKSPFFVNSRLKPWDSEAGPRRAGVSAFGIGGTNAHVILEEAPQAKEPGPSRPLQLLLLSARSLQGLDAATARLKTHLQSSPDLDLADLCYTLKVGRKALGHRRFFVCRDKSDALQALADPARGRSYEVDRESAPVPVVFLFPGQGAAWHGLGKELYRVEKVFREQVEECCSLLEPQLERDLREVLFPAREEREEAARLLRRTAWNQPALFTLEYSLARLLMAWGIHPQAMIGHSLGEYVAACLSGVFPLPDVLELVVHRGRLMESVSGGAMLAVPLEEEELAAFLKPPLSLAAVNEPGRAVVSGPKESIEALRRQLKDKGVASQPLETTCAFHSSMMEPILDDFRKRVSQVQRHAPQIPFISNLSGDWISRREARDPDYWTRHLRRTVRFSQGVAKLLEGPGRILLEVGPGSALTGVLRRRQHKPTGVHCFPSMSRRAADPSDLEALLTLMGSLWSCGAVVDWSGFYADQQRRRVCLPTYPFQREVHWVEAKSRHSGPVPRADGEAEPPVAASQVPGQASPEPRPEGSQAVSQDLAEILSGLLGVEAGSLPQDATFLEMGADSLLLLQFSQGIEKHFGVKLPFRRIMEEFTTLETLSQHLQEELPEWKVPDPPSKEARAGQGQSMAARQQTAAIQAEGDLEEIVRQQLSIMSRQIELLREGAAAATASSLSSQHSVRSTAESGSSRSARPSSARETPKRPAPFVPYQPIQPGQKDLTPEQQKHLSSLFSRLEGRSKRSKALARDYRRSMADSRGSADFRLLWKEVLYPIAVERAEGARVWDVDGNEYVDITMGFGSLLFGHSPKWIIEALQEQIGDGLQIGLQSPLAGQAAELICRMTGMERAAFFNSGTEAVLTALRLARTVTGRSKIALFKGSYHGFSDEVLVRSLKNAQGRPVTMPMAPGISPHVSDQVLVLDYCSPESLQILEERGQELAAILVEPQQSRLPGYFDVADYLPKLRDVSKRTGATLIFDEVVTGFRVHPGGVQGLYGIQADLATYGKSMGGGVPVGAVAGQARYLDAIDGGDWNYGDASYPQAETTFVAGTYFKHPLTMAAVWASLNHLQEQGPQLQRDLNQSTRHLVERLQEVFRQENVAMEMLSFGSLFRFRFAEEVKYPSIFYYHLLDNGIHVWEGRAFYLSTAHQERDLEELVEAVRKSVEAMRGVGLLPEAEPSDKSRPGSIGPSHDSPKQVRASEAQKALWALGHLNENASRAYNESLTARLREKVDYGALRSALQEVVNRHQALRSSFDRLGEKLTIASRLRIEVPLVALDGLEKKEQQHQAAQWAWTEARQVFDLERGPLFRFRLLSMGEEDALLIVTFHHSVTDGLSNGILLKEIRDLYGAACRDQSLGLPQVSQFSDFIEWQFQKQQGPKLEQAGRFWSQQFADGVPVLELPADAPRPPLMSFQGSRQYLCMRGDVCHKLRDTATRRGGTLFSLLLAAICTLLHRLSGQDDLVVGTTSAGQVSMGQPGLVGYCVNLLPIRSRIAHDPTFEEYFSWLQKLLLDAYEHQDYPFHRLVKKLDLPLDASRPPLASVVVNVDQVGGSGEGDSLGWEVASNPNGTTKFDLYFDIEVRKDSIEFKCDFNGDILRDKTVRRWLEHLERLLREITVNSGRRLSRLALMDPKERRGILEIWQSALDDRDEQALLPVLLQESAQACPDKVALVCRGKHLTYQTLADRSNQLARYLRESGIGAETSVAVLMERSSWLIVALTGILKSGGAYLPLDPRHPGERLSLILEAAGAECVITQASLAPRFKGNSIKTLIIDEQWEEISTHSSSPLRQRFRAHNLAYVIFTSGSTGQPKGVQISHLALANFLGALRARPGLGKGAVFLALTTVSFDIAALEIFLPLISGARLILAGGEETTDPTRLGHLMAKSRPHVMQATPSGWQLLLKGGWQGDPRLQAWCGGEALSSALAKSLRERCASLWNLYGPTEATIWSNMEEVGDPDRITIGTPIAGMAAYVLDRWLEPPPQGVVGSLYLAGRGLARGYLSQPGLTASKFLPHPFRRAGGERIYETGDLARYLPDGRIQVLGRLDDQVKIRGMRIELGEIEAALKKHPAIEDAIVSAQTVSPEESRLTAHFIATRQESPDVGNLRSFMARSLPDYMIPGHFTEMQSFPLTPNGKIDRKALPAPDATRPRLAERYRPPISAIEKKLAGIWAETLRVDKVGVDDNFIELGGDSILAVQTVARARQEGIEMTPLQLFRNQSISELADALGRKSSAEAGQIPLESEEKKSSTTDAAVSASDFPAAKLSQERLEKLLSELE